MRYLTALAVLTATASFFLFIAVVSKSEPPDPYAHLGGPTVSRWLVSDAVFHTDPTLTPTPTTTATFTPTATPTVTPEPTATPEPPPPPTEAPYVPPPAETEPEPYVEPEPVYYGSDIEALICSFGWDCATALRIARCESGLNPNAYNGHHIGLFQVDPNYHTWRSATGELWSAYGNVSAAYHLWAEQGWRPWSCY